MADLRGSHAFHLQRNDNFNLHYKDNNVYLRLLIFRIFFRDGNQRCIPKEDASKALTDKLFKYLQKTKLTCVFVYTLKLNHLLFYLC